MHSKGADSLPSSRSAKKIDYKCRNETWKKCFELSIDPIEELFESLAGPNNTSISFQDFMQKLENKGILSKIDKSHRGKISWFVDTKANCVTQ